MTLHAGFWRLFEPRVARHRRAWCVAERLERRVLPAAELRTLMFNATSGWLTLVGDETTDIVIPEVRDDGFVEVMTNGHTHSSNPQSASFDVALAGANRTTLAGISLIGGGGNDRLILNSLELPEDFSVRSDAAVEVAGLVKVSGDVSIAGSELLVSGTLQAHNVLLESARQLEVTAAAQLTARDGDVGGSVGFSADVLLVGGLIDVNGVSGGRIRADARNFMHYGQMTADGSTGSGGSVQIEFRGQFVEIEAGLISANGAGSGGLVSIDGGTSGHLFASGQQQAIGSGRDSIGGQVTLLGRDIVLVGARVDASGTSGGGTVLIGGDYHGANSAVPNARTAHLSASTSFRADALAAGDGGRVIVWSDETTEFYGQATARGGSVGGDGGFIEVSAILRTAQSEMFNRYAIGVRAHADGVGVKQSNVSFQAVRGIKANCISAAPATPEPAQASPARCCSIPRTSLSARPWEYFRSLN